MLLAIYNDVLVKRLRLRWKNVVTSLGLLDLERTGRRWDLMPTA
jgi:hypothetical protein